MANHNDAIKRNKQNIKLRAHNKHYRTMMRNQVKKVRAAVEGGDKEAAASEFRKAVAIIQRVAAKRVIHKNQAARRVSRLNAAVRGM